MTIQEAPLPRSKVPVWQTVKAAYRDTFGKLRAFLIAAAVSFALSVAIDVLLPDQEIVGIGVLNTVASTLVASIFELAWLRYLLLGREATPRLMPSADRRVARFVGYSMLLTLLVLPTRFVQPILPEALHAVPHVAVAAAIIVYVVGSYCSVRLGFVFPWIALDAPERLGASWRATRGNGLRILLAMLLVGLPLLLPLFAFGTVLGIVAPEQATAWEEGTIEGALWWVILAGGQVLLFLYYGLSCAVLVRAFCVLTGWMSDRSELLERFE